jgi:hypothetical protein
MAKRTKQPEVEEVQESHAPPPAPPRKTKSKKVERVPRINSSVRGGGRVFDPGDEDDLYEYLGQLEGGSKLARKLENKGVISNFTSVSHS